ncbi:ABC transporter permease [Puniceicoccales bacterium CK1056]|uniref:ABC transporter permease n=1 Tax=Oceanipulchritudo coccoides TaxID=2706888 RepID=A0A6B2M1H3_9BACT|nr:ABC transporter permease [Oceanipulchritudo coccoides]NDV61984.1 ABC transporter permease [Oceanipulchritudo coccoides]
MNAFVSDFLYAFRILFKRPGLTLLAIVALSVSLGMTTTTFSVLNGLLFKPLPFENPEELHHIYLKGESYEAKMMPLPFDELGSLDGVECFDEIMAYYSGTINISGEGTPERYTGAFVSPNFLSLLGHEPEMGRSFSDEAILPDGPREILISHEMWESRFRSDPEILKKTIRANGSEHAVVGVLPEGFHFPSNAHAWVPLNRTLFPGDENESMHVIAVGRLNGDSTARQARDELEALYASWDGSQIEQKDQLQLTCQPFGRLEMNSASQSILVVTISSVIFILLVSCANVANLLVGRALSRGREMAIRAAIGATRRRIIQQLLTESLVLSLIGAVGGLLFAAWSVDVSTESALFEFPYWMNFELDWRVFGFVVLVMLGTAMISGFIPAWQASKTDLNEMLKDTSHTSTSFRLGKLTRLLAVVQIAFSCALLFGAGLVARNTLDMSRIDPQFQAEDILTMRMGLFPRDYPEEADRDEFYAELTKVVEEVPGVSGCAVTSWIGMFGNFEVPFIMAGLEDEQPKVNYAFIESVSPGYFNTMQMQTATGRTFLDSDDTGSANVVVVNQEFVRRFMGGQNPVGKSLSLVTSKLEGSSDWQNDNFRVVGVVSDVRVSNFTKPAKTEAIIYAPYRQTASSFMSLIVNADEAGNPELQNSIQQAILTLDPHLPVYFSQTMASYIDEQIYPYKLMANYFLSIGLMALFLAAIGVYGMLAFNVSRRRREIGIRMALGANTRNIISKVLQQGLYQMVVGIIVGTGFAYLIGQFIRNFLFGVNPLDPSVYIGVLFTLIGVATLAFFLPARKASRLSPMEALRYE